MAKQAISKKTKTSGRTPDGKFAEGNQESVGNQGGRTPFFNNPEELETKVEEYFIWVKGEYEERSGDRTITKKDGTIINETYTYWFTIRERETPSVTGLAMFLGFESRQSMYDYEKKAEFSYSIKKALLKVENTYEGGLWQEKPTGAIFALKNMGWVDSKEIKQDVVVDDKREQIDYSKLDTETLKKLKQARVVSKNGD